MNNLQDQSDWDMNVVSPLSYEDVSTQMNPIIAIDTETLKGFPKLPIELRIKIWGYILPGPRIIDVNVIDGLIRINCPPPVALHVCKESRQEALKNYSLLLSTKTAPGQDPIDPKMDILNLSYYTFPCPAGGPFLPGSPITGFFASASFVADGVRSKIRNLAMDMDVWTTIMGCAGWDNEGRPTFPPNLELLDSLAEFTALKELTIVIHDSRCSDNWRMRCIDVDFIEPDVSLDDRLDRDGCSTTEEFEDFLHEVQVRNPNWQVPKLKFVEMTRGGIKCCTWDVEREQN